MKWIKGNGETFRELLKQNNFQNLYYMFGHDLTQGGYVQLKSGSLISSTTGWNPMVFAFLFDHNELVEYFVANEHDFDVRQCM